VIFTEETPLQKIPHGIRGVVLPKSLGALHVFGTNRLIVPSRRGGGGGWLALPGESARQKPWLTIPYVNEDSTSQRNLLLSGRLISVLETTAYS
jgi:hypothetical protein